MMAISVFRNHLPQIGLNAANAIPKFGTILITTLAINVLSNLPKANALGHFWKAVNENCYYRCKEAHGWKGPLCFAACVSMKNFE